MEDTTVTITYGNDQYLDIPAIKLTVEEVYNALKQNGFEHLRRDWYSDSKDAKGKPVGACVLGQASLNLNGLGYLDSEDDRFLAPSVIKAIDEAENGKDADDIYVGINQYTLNNQLDNFQVPGDSKWNINGRVGATIIHWNDKKKDTGRYDHIKEMWVYDYELETYEEVVAMAYDLLSPYFDRIITLVKAQYEEVAVPA